MNKNSVTAQLRNKSKELKVNYAILQAFFFYEEFLKLFSQSPYQENFILKGGLLISAMTGISSRATADIDFLMNRQPMDESFLKTVIQEIIANPDTSTVYFEFTKIEPIHDTDDYGGFRIHLRGRLSNIRQPFYIDIATGDPVTPEPEQFKYHSLFNETIPIKSYPLETILAEKIQTILIRADANGRSKDFYDVYLLMKLKGKEIRSFVLSQAIKNTFEYRKTEIPSKENSLLTLDLIQNDAGCNKRWTQYINKNPYTSRISFQTALQACRQILERYYLEIK
jgi:predicted nucleotidyltransferase component of viral defense system